MNKTTTDYVLPSWLRPWEQFWFTPADPSLLALIRIMAGLIVVYTFVVYTFSLQDFMGEHGWHDMQFRDQIRYGRPVNTGTVDWSPVRVLPEPRNKFEQDYRDDYFKRHKVLPPPPYPANQEEAEALEAFGKKFGVDLRANGLTIPQNEFQWQYADDYARLWKIPPPAFAKDEEEAQAIQRYMEEFKTDPRQLYDKGMPLFSLYFHVLDPDAMLIIHWGFVVCSVLFLIGFLTRITTALTWFGLLCYIHRNPTTLFGVDTMMLIVLLYLMISPCGAICSVDLLIRRWWVHAKPGVVAGWYRFWRMAPPAVIAPAASPDVEPTVAANIAIRLLQIHVCIIYLFAGVSKLQGQAWWNGTALWLTLGNYEFAPMQLTLYLKFLRLLGRHQWLYEGFMTTGGLFTLAFEISYAFLIWRPRLRWLLLGSAILLHGFIGLFMGLKTFSLMMLVMNMAFLSKDEVLWCLKWFALPSPSSATAAVPPPATAPLQQPVSSSAVTGIKTK